MTNLTRMALPVPGVGSALTEKGDEYVASLLVEIVIDGQVALTVTGTAFEEIMSAVRLRHLAFHPRMRALMEGHIKAPSLVAAIERHWSAIDSHGDAQLNETADTIVTLARAVESVTWNQAN